MKKLITISIAASLLVLTSQIALASFNDVDSDFHQYTAINWLESQEVVEGYGDGTYRPEEPVNRAEFLKMLYETIGMEGYTPTLPFIDVPDDEWFTKYVQEAYQTEVVMGYSDDTFRPDDTINLAEALKIISVSFFPDVVGYGEGVEYINYCPDGALDFDDLSSGDHLAQIDKNSWYWEHVVVTGELCVFDFGLNAYGIGGLWMDSYVDRGDMAELLYRAKTVRDNATIDWYDPYTDDQEPDLIIEVLPDIACTEEGESLGAVVPDNFDNYCCEGSVGYLEEGIIGSFGTCVDPDSLVMELEISEIFPSDNDQFSIVDDSISIEEDILTFEVSYEGGCAADDFNLYWNSYFLESDPVQISIKLIHDDNDDECSVEMQKSLSYDISSLKESYQDGYQSDSGEIVITISGSGEETESINYEF
jgi:hypothetical protein